MLSPGTVTHDILVISGPDGHLFVEGVGVI